VVGAELREPPGDGRARELVGREVRLIAGQQIAALAPLEVLEGRMQPLEVNEHLVRAADVARDVRADLQRPQRDGRDEEDGEHRCGEADDRPRGEWARRLCAYAVSSIRDGCLGHTAAYPCAAGKGSPEWADAAKGSLVGSLRPRIAWTASTSRR